MVLWQSSWTKIFYCPTSGMIWLEEMGPNCILTHIMPPAPSTEHFCFFDPRQPSIGEGVGDPENSASTLSFSWIVCNALNNRLEEMRKPFRQVKHLVSFSKTKTAMAISNQATVVKRCLEEKNRGESRLCTISKAGSLVRHCKRLWQIDQSQEQINPKTGDECTYTHTCLCIRTCVSPHPTLQKSGT